MLLFESSHMYIIHCVICVNQFKYSVSGRTIFPLDLSFNNSFCVVALFYSCIVNVTRYTNNFIVFAGSHERKKKILPKTYLPN